MSRIYRSLILQGNIRNSMFGLMMLQQDRCFLLYTIIWPQILSTHCRPPLSLLLWNQLCYLYDQNRRCQYNIVCHVFVSLKHILNESHLLLLSLSRAEGGSETRHSGACMKSHPLDCHRQSDPSPSQRNSQSSDIKRLAQTGHRQETGED